MTSSGVAKYAAVRRGLLERIAEMDPGEQLPVEADLCQEYGVSRTTLRHAVDGLVQDGRLSRQHGRGTFVTSSAGTARYPEHFSDNIRGFYRQQVEAGYAVTTRVLGQRIVHADETVADHLGLTFADRVIELRRLRYVDHQLHHHVVTYLSYDRFPELLDHDFTHGSLYGELEERYDVRLVRNDLVVGVEDSSPETAELLAVSPGERLLRLDSTVFDAETAVGYGIARHTPGSSEIMLSLRTTQTPA